MSGPTQDNTPRQQEQPATGMPIGLPEVAEQIDLETASPEVVAQVGELRAERTATELDDDRDSSAVIPATGTPQEQDPRIQPEHTAARRGTPGVIRTEEQLTSQQVAEVMQDQLMHFKPEDIAAIVGRFEPARQELAREVMARASDYGSFDSFQKLREQLDPLMRDGGQIYAPPGSSLGRNIDYLFNQKNRDPSNKLPTTQELGRDTVIVLDETILRRLETDQDFARDVAKSGAKLVYPRGFENGLGMFQTSTADKVFERTMALVEAAEKIRDSSETPISESSAVRMALDQPVMDRIIGRLDKLMDDGQINGMDYSRVVKNFRLLGDWPAYTDKSDLEIAVKLNGETHVGAGEIEDAVRGLSKEDRELMREMLVQRCDVNSHRSMAGLLEKQYDAIMKLAEERGISPDKVYFFDPTESQGRPDVARSSAMVNMSFRLTNGIQPERFITGLQDLKDRQLGDDTMLVTLDDLILTGNTMRDETVWLPVQQLRESGDFDGRLVIAPLLAAQPALTSTHPVSPGFETIKHTDHKFNELLADQEVQALMKEVPAVAAIMDRQIFMRERAMEIPQVAALMEKNEDFKRLMTEEAGASFTMVRQGDDKLDVLPQKVLSGIKESEFYRGLDEKQRAALERICESFGYGETGTAITLPYMAPDNNARRFARELARVLTLNGQGVKNLSERG